MYKTTRARRWNAEGQDSSRGYRSIWHTLQMNGMRVPIVEMLLREIDPEGVSERRHRLRRNFHSLGPNCA